MRPTRRAGFALVVGVMAQACLAALPEPDPDVGCGNEAEPCCTEGAPACGASLRCDAAAGRCVEAEHRYCVSNEQCEAGRSCCISGLIGSCVEAGPGLACPQADLQVEVSPEALGLSLETRVVDPEFDACAIEKGCVGAAGERRLLHFSAAVRNAGDADLLFGSSSAAPHLEAACDGQPYFADFLTYSLVDAQGGVQASGRQQARCDTQAGYASGFDCQFNAIEQGAAQVYSARPWRVADDVAERARRADFIEGQFSAPLDDVCQWIDVTDVPAGDYLLRIQVNEGGVLAEARSDNNRVDVRVTLPAQGDPTRACPGNDAAWLLGYAEGRECGWVAVGPAVSCTPGTIVTPACATCSGAPLLRACEGLRACTALEALGTSYSFQLEDGGCPGLEFLCPASGAYTVYGTASGRSDVALTCMLQNLP